MVLYFIILSALVAFSFGADDEGLKAEWEAFKAEYGKKYKSKAEEEERFKVFAATSKFILNHNEKFANGDVSYILSMNEFGDMSQEEWVSSYKCVDDEIVDDKSLPTYQPPKNFDKNNLPDRVDWRSHGYVTDVKDQGYCRSCWAFSATGALEGQQFQETGVLFSLSEQNLVDCSTNFGNDGCGGGLPEFAYKYIIENNGIDEEESYPYEGDDKTCRFKKENVGATVKNISKIHPTEEDLKAAVANVGPISVLINADLPEFKHYKDGIFDHPECPKYVTHAVLVVGYGIEDGMKYWFVKNSWGRNWGMDGYALMARDKDNQCSIASYAIFPVV